MAGRGRMRRPRRLRRALAADGRRRAEPPRRGRPRRCRLRMPGHACSTPAAAPGGSAIELARRGIDVVGVDLDADMLYRARAKAPELTWVHCGLGQLRSGPHVRRGGAGRQRHRRSWPTAERAAAVAGCARHLGPGRPTRRRLPVCGRAGRPLADYDGWCAAAGLEARVQRVAHAGTATPFGRTGADSRRHGVEVGPGGGDRGGGAGPPLAALGHDHLGQHPLVHAEDDRPVVGVAGPDVGELASRSGSSPPGPSAAVDQRVRVGRAPSRRRT